MEGMNLLDYVFAVLAVVGGAAFLWLVYVTGQWVRGKTDNEAWNQIEGFVTKLVESAEQMTASGQLQADLRYQWVLQRLQARFPDFTDEDAKDMIESAVYWMRESQRVFKKKSATEEGEPETPAEPVANEE